MKRVEGGGMLSGFSYTSFYELFTEPAAPAPPPPNHPTGLTFQESNLVIGLKSPSVRIPAICPKAKIESNLNLQPHALNKLQNMCLMK